MERRFLNIKEVSEYLGLKQGTVYSWVCYKKIPYIKMGRLVKFDIKRIDQWMQASTVEVMA